MRPLWRKLRMKACMEGRVMFLIDAWRVAVLDLRCGMEKNLVMSGKLWLNYRRN